MSSVQLKCEELKQVIQVYSELHSVNEYVSYTELWQSVLEDLTSFGELEKEDLRSMLYSKLVQQEKVPGSLGYINLFGPEHLKDTIRSVIDVLTVKHDQLNS